MARWRDDPAVRTSRGRELTVRHRGRIPAILDGEAHKLRADTVVRYRPAAFRALALSDLDAPSPAAATGVRAPVAAV